MKLCKHLLCGLLALNILVMQGGASTVQSSTSTTIYKLKYMQLATEQNTKWSPNVAYSPAHRVYLAVWENLWSTGKHDIYGRLIYPNGQMGQEFIVSSGANYSKQPDVAYDSVNDIFLVIWSYDYYGDGSDFDIYARAIPWNGPNSSDTPFWIDQSGSSTSKPRLVYAPDLEEFLVVWKVEGDSPAISGAFFEYERMGKWPIPISSGPELRDFPDVTYNQTSHEFVVVWDEDTGRDYMDLDIYAIRLNVNGQPLGLGEFVVSNLYKQNEQHPSVAACAAGNEVFFVWQQQVNQVSTDDNIFGRLMHFNGVLDQIYGVEGTTLRQQYPHIRCNPSGDTYFLVWQDQYAQPALMFGIWGTLIHLGFVIEPAFEVVRPSDTANRLYPAAAIGENTVLVAWQHERDAPATVKDIWGVVAMLNPHKTFIPMVAK